MKLPIIVFTKNRNTFFNQLKSKILNRNNIVVIGTLTLKKERYFSKQTLTASLLISFCLKCFFLFCKMFMKKSVDKVLSLACGHRDETTFFFSLLFLPLARKVLKAFCEEKPFPL